MHGERSDLEAYLLPSSFRFGGKPVGLGVLYEPTCIFPRNEGTRDLSPQLETSFERMLFSNGCKYIYVLLHTRSAELDLIRCIVYALLKKTRSIYSTTNTTQSLV